MLVQVLFPLNLEALTYEVCSSIANKVKIGVRVLAPFRNKTKYGIITDFGRDVVAIDSVKLKSIETIEDEQSLLPETLVRLMQWVKDYYLCTSGIALKAVLPKGVLEGKRPGKARQTLEPVPQSFEPVKLNEEQTEAVERIQAAQDGVFLIHGVTGSGKTEVYMEAIDRLTPGKQALVLVPEIALTSQIIGRFQQRFGDEVAFYHSRLSQGERITQWHRMRSGKIRVALGVRAAVFAPLTNLALIVVDEEHDTSYKQSEGLRYNARDTAIVRARFEGIRIILGSATPSVETFYHAQNGKFTYLQLTRRFEQRPMPAIEVIDIKRTKKKTHFLSEKLFNAIVSEHEQGRQSLLLLNRRGYSPFFMCFDCGYIFKCKNCSVSLTYHKDKNLLICHSCGRSYPVFAFCPQCNNPSVRFAGIGTQRLEEELKELLSDIKLCRMDRDSTTGKLAHASMVSDMESGAIELLLGTQMVAKGHNFPSVTLAGVVSADVGLNLPDFRSSERSFQLFIQLAGRAGRGQIPGKVYIQTYCPDHYVLSYVKAYDYKGFFEREIAYRQELAYPPFAKLIRIIFRKQDEDSKALENILKHDLKDVITTNTKGLEILGPCPAPIEKSKKFWRWHLLIKGKNSQVLRNKALEVVKNLKKHKLLKIEIDIDPVDML